MLPPPCQMCAPNDGAWAQTTSGLKRCSCARGVALADNDADRKQAVKAKASKAADKAKKSREAKKARAVVMRKRDRELNAKYREMPLLEQDADRWWDR